MSPRTTARRVAWLLLLAACGDGDEPEEPPRPPEPPPIAAGQIKLVNTRPPGWDLVIHVPWKDNYKPLSEHEWQFAGPGEPGEKPEMDFGWKASDRDLETYARESFRRYDSPAYKVLGKGNATIAGMPARYCVFETGKMRAIEYCFAGHGYIGFVRGISKIDEFGKWGPIFEEAARRVRYDPQ